MQRSHKEKEIATGRRLYYHKSGKIWRRAPGSGYNRTMAAKEFAPQTALIEA